MTAPFTVFDPVQGKFVPAIHGDAQRSDGVQQRKDPALRFQPALFLSTGIVRITGEDNGNILVTATGSARITREQMREAVALFQAWDTEDV